jgi:mono/diheme cytochrome c family protein
MSRLVTVVFHARFAGVSRMRFLQTTWMCCVFAWSGAALAAAGETEDFFTQQVHPILQEHCFKCHSHGGDKIKGGLVVDSLEGLLTGGDTSPAIVPGAPDKSLLIKAVRYTDEDLQMPPKGKRLLPAQVATLEKWIADGAKWPGESGKPKRARGKITDEDRNWWAFLPVSKPVVPSVRDSTWARNDIDRFILAKLEENSLKPATEASRRVLARRLYFDLWGLPPTPEALEDFVRDNSETAYERLVDTLLASPRYGERWARHWLDLVRYADSDGYKIDELRPTAWRYRDYVIQSLNQDKPYDEFVREQLAGDEMEPRTPERLVATGYLRHWIYEYNNRDAVGQWTTILNDITDTTGDVFLGMGLQCARCHDHKFDPILQKDYYAMQAFFAPIQPREDIDLATDAERAAHRQKLKQWEDMTAEVRAEIAELEKKYRDKAAADAVAKFPEETQALIAKPVVERTPLEHQHAELAYRQVVYEYDHLHTKIKGDNKEKHVALLKKLAQFDQYKPAPLPRALIVTDVGSNSPPTIIPKKNTPVDPDFPTVLAGRVAAARPAAQTIALPKPGAAIGHGSTGRRSALANWLTDPSNPLTARVMVNRVWHYHFGRGLAATTSDFGRLGEKPTHPELLDWLTHRFVADGWSLKKLHKTIVTSATYRQSSSSGSDSMARRVDPENRLLWHRSVRRLDAEQIRDALLAASRELQLEEGGPAVDTFKPRRSIYTKVLRNTRDPLLDVFDAPQNFSSTSERDTTTTPVQSLFLINSQYMLQRSRVMATQLQSNGVMTDADFAAAAYNAVLGRGPTAEELDGAVRFLKEQPGRVDPARMTSAAAAFVADKVPYRDGKGALMNPKSTQDRLIVPQADGAPHAQFTIEAFIVLRSLYEDASVRTIASQWSGKKDDPGWSFGVTSTKSMRRPQTLVLQLTGKDSSGGKAYDAVFSDLHINLNRPYYVAVAVDLANTNEAGVTFYAKDLANDDEPMQTAQVPHRVAGSIQNKASFVIGGRNTAGEHLFDGVIDDVRLSRGVLPAEQLLLTSTAVGEKTWGYWQFEAKPDVFRDASAQGHHILPSFRSEGMVVDKHTAARADFCHVLMNANEFLYVE